MNCISLFQDKLLTGSFDCKIKVWDIATDTCLKTLESHSHFVMCILATDNFFFSGSEDKTIKIWNKDFDNTETLEGHKDAVSCL